MKYILFVFISSLVLMNHSFAYEVLKEETICESADGRAITCGFLEGSEAKKKMEEMKKLKKNSTSVRGNAAVTATDVTNKECKVNKNTTIDSTHYYLVTNPLSTAVDLQLSYQLHSVYGKSIHNFWIRLNPGEKKESNSYSYLAIHPDKLGQTQLTSSTEFVAFGPKATDSAILTVIK